MARNEIDVKAIKRLIQEAELKAAKAQGQLEQIEKKWKESFGEGTLAAAKKAYEDLQKKIKKQEERRDELVKELEDLYDWESLEDE